MAVFIYASTSSSSNAAHMAPTHDTQPPPNWPPTTTYLLKPRLSRTFPSALIPLITTSPTFASRPAPHPSSVHIKRISEPSHPAHDQCGLFTKRRMGTDELIIPYLGVVHASFVRDPDHHSEDSVATPPVLDHDSEESDYDLSLLRVSSADSRNPFLGWHVSIGVDAADAGNAARMVNDYRGVPGVTAPNAEFRLGRGEGGELRMEVWTMKGAKAKGIDKGEEVLVSYGKGWWGARKG